jgi:hypothetical protein
MAVADRNGRTIPTPSPSNTALNCSNAVRMSYTISGADTAGSGRPSESSRLLSLSQKMSRFRRQVLGSLATTFLLDRLAPGEPDTTMPTNWPCSGTEPVMSVVPLSQYREP